MESPKSLIRLVERLAHPEGANDRVSHSTLATSEVPSLLALTTTTQGQWHNELAQIALWRAFVATLPAYVFEYPEKPCRPHVTKRLKHLLGEDPAEQLVDQLMIVVKRLQRYLIGGRASLADSSFDVNSAFHAKLLRDQAGRCGNCGYRFEFNDLDEDASAGITATVDAPIAGSWDRSPLQLGRKAVLDHVFPLYLAGDDQLNWQILCRTCNEGKSDLVFPLAASEWFGSARASQFVRTRPRLFYMILARDGACGVCARGPTQVELRLRRRDPDGADTYTNLAPVCRSWAPGATCA